MDFNSSFVTSFFSRLIYFSCVIIYSLHARASSCGQWICRQCAKRPKGDGTKVSESRQMTLAICIILLGLG